MPIFVMSFAFAVGFKPRSTQFFRLQGRLGDGFLWKFHLGAEDNPSLPRSCGLGGSLAKIHEILSSSWEAIDCKLKLAKNTRTSNWWFQIGECFVNMAPKWFWDYGIQLQIVDSELDTWCEILALHLALYFWFCQSFVSFKLLHVFLQIHEYMFICSCFYYVFIYNVYLYSY